jgi:hypothetical protein
MITPRPTARPATMPATIATALKMTSPWATLEAKRGTSGRRLRRRAQIQTPMTEAAGTRKRAAVKAQGSVDTSGIVAR